MDKNNLLTLDEAIKLVKEKNIDLNDFYSAIRNNEICPLHVDENGNEIKIHVTDFDEDTGELEGILYDG